MKYLLLFSSLMLSAYYAAAQNQEIEIGKRKNVIWDRKIDSLNLATSYTNFYPIYYKFPASKYSRAGLYSKNIFSNLNPSNTSSISEFYKFRRNKVVSHVLLAAAISMLSAWTYRGGVLFASSTDPNMINAYLKNKQFLLIGGYALAIGTAFHFNKKGDQKMKNAIRYHNARLRF